MAESDTQLPRLLTARQVAEWLGISEQALAQDRYRGEGVPYVKVGQRIRYRLPDLVKYLDDNVNVPPVPPSAPVNRPARTHKMNRV